MNQKTKQKTTMSGGGDFSSDLSISHEVKAPSIDEILKAAKQALSSADKTIKEQKGGRCGCF